MKTLIFAICLLSSVCFAQSPTPAITNFQGRITDANGNPAPSGTGYEMEVRIWSAGTGGTLIWGTRYTGIAVQNGAYSVILGSGGTPITGAQTTDLRTAFESPARYLGVTVTKNAAGNSISSPSEMLPRQQMMTVPYAFKADFSARSSLSDSATLAQTVSPGSVNSAAIADESIIANDLSIGSVTAVKIAQGAVGTTQLADGSVIGAKIQDASLDISKMKVEAATFVEEKPSGQGSSDVGNNPGVRRTLNKTIFSSGSSISRLGSLITLQPGTYRINASAPVGPNSTGNTRTFSQQLEIRDVSNSNSILRGTSVAGSAPSNFFTVFAQCEGVVSVTGNPVVLEIFHWFNGFISTLGSPGNNGPPETYTTITIIRLN